MVRVYRYAYKEEDALGIISNDINQINQIDITPLIDDLETLEIFKDKDRKEGDSITDALSTILRLLGEELEEASQLIQAQSRLDPVKLYNEEQ